MRINTKKINTEMKRLGITPDRLGKLLEPPRSRQAAVYIIKHGKTFTVLEQIAKVMNLGDPKDLIIGGFGK